MCVYLHEYWHCTCMLYMLHVGMNDEISSFLGEIFLVMTAVNKLYYERFDVFISYCLISLELYLYPHLSL